MVIMVIWIWMNTLKYGIKRINTYLSWKIRKIEKMNLYLRYTLRWNLDLDCLECSPSCDAQMWEMSLRDAPAPAPIQWTMSTPNNHWLAVGSSHNPDSSFYSIKKCTFLIWWINSTLNIVNTLYRKMIIVLIMWQDIHESCRQ